MKTRFAPSPTGLIHLGNARTALFSALYAAGQHGSFLLRIEDTDKARSTEEYIHKLCHDLKWLGIHWQEGEQIGGEHQPYRQSERDSIYDHYYHRLQELGRAYPCFCSEEELDLERKLQKALGQPPRYSGKCKHLTQEQKAAKVTAGIKPTLRFEMKSGDVIKFKDLVKGKQSFKAEDIGDFIIRRNDGGSAFMFCNAIDDSLMGVTHVLRGEDHVTNTPRQLIILRALELREPQYAHMALINGTDGAPLSKRKGSRNIQEFREQGFLPIAVANYMARLGHYYEQNDLLTWEGLAKHFSLERLGSSAARFDEDQLLFWQRTAVHSLGDLEFETWIMETLKNTPAEKKALFIATIRDNVLFPKDAAYYADILLNHTFKPKAHKEVLAEAGAVFFENLLKAIELYGVNFTAISEYLTRELNVKGKALFQPIRVALTGELHGPKLGEMMELIGLESVRARIQQVKETI